MEHCRKDEKPGRYIGRAGDMDVYSSGIVKTVSLPGRPPERSAPDGELWFDYGPAAGGLLESVGIRLLTPGEHITEASVNPYFKKRSLKVIGSRVMDALLTVERINGFHSASHAVAFCSAVEDALGIKRQQGVEMGRIVMLEMERVRSNLEVVKRLCEPAGFGVPYSQIGYLRERVSRLISSMTGHRYFFSSVSPGNALLDIAGLKTGADSIESDFKRIYRGLLQSKIFLNRLQNNGKNDSHDILVGPAARAANRKVDARMDSSSVDYSGMNFTIPVEEEADSFARFIVRSEEIFQSLSLVRNASGKYAPQGQENDLTGSGEGSGRVESPQGDLFYHVRIEDGTLMEIRMLSPSISNIRAFESSMAGNIFTDFHFNWESYGIWISEAGVEFL